MDMKEYFISELKSTKRKGIKALIEYLENSDFFTAPASTAYHGAYPGGLLEHSINVLNCLRFEYANLQDSDYILPEIPEESIIITALLHDLCKVNTYVEWYRNVKNEDTGKWEKVKCYKREPLLAMGHGGKSVFIAQQFIQLTVDEATAIYWHMSAYDAHPSGYNTYNELSKAYSTNLLAFLLHTADMKATYIAENHYPLKK